MDINWNENPAAINGTGGASITVPAGKSLKIETSPNGTEVLDAECPAGKQWKVHISVFIEESNE